MASSLKIDTAWKHCVFNGPRFFEGKSCIILGCNLETSKFSIQPK